ncbi:MAG: sulfite exporter TauE/SafE family protein [Acidimicrobiales bacterium]
MTPEHGIVLGIAGLLGGAVNSVAGGGSLISFPALLAVGYPSITANVTNTVALWPGYLGATAAYRPELEGQRSRLLALGATSIAGGLAGSVMLLTTPASVFKAVVPFLILLACGLFGAQPLVSKVMEKHDTVSKQHRSGGLHVAVFCAAVYGAYFGAGLGIILLAVLGLVISDSLQRLNGLKQVMSVLINSVAVVTYGVFGHVAWSAVAIMAVAALVGGRLGGSYARKLSPVVLRVLVLGFGISVGCILLARQ